MFKDRLAGMFDGDGVCSGRDEVGEMKRVKN